MSSTETQNPIIWVLVAIAALVLLGPLLMLLFAAPMMGGWMMGGPWGGSGMAPAWSFVWLLVPLAVLVGLGYLGYRALQGGVGGIGRDRALEELRLAYARGDVTEEEYERRREQLERDRER